MFVKYFNDSGLIKIALHFKAHWYIDWLSLTGVGYWQIFQESLGKKWKIGSKN
jgi:hypothetical protein